MAFSPSPTSNPLSTDRLLSVSLLYFSNVLMLAGYGLHIVVVFILVATGPHPAPPWGATDGGSSGVPVAVLSSTQQRTGTCCFLINWWPGRWWAAVNNKWCYTMQQYWLVPCSCSFFRISNKESFTEYNKYVSWTLWSCVYSLLIVVSKAGRSPYNLMTLK